MGLSGLLVVVLGLAGSLAPPPASPDAKAKALQQQVASAIASGASRLSLPGGAYHFGSTNFQIEGAEDLALLAPEPLQLVFVGPAGVNVTNCRNLSLGNLSISYEQASRGGLEGAELLPANLAAQGITLNLLNSSRVCVSDVSITGASFMVITAWNGYGDHHFTRYGCAIPLGPLPLVFSHESETSFCGAGCTFSPPWAESVATLCTSQTKSSDRLSSIA